MYDIPGAIKAAFEALAKWLGYRQAVLAERNTEAMKRAEAAKQEQAVEDSARKAVSSGDDDAIRKAVSILVVLALVSLAGCARTIAPASVVSNTIAWDGTNQNAGILGHTASHELIITPGGRDRYNALVSAYGSKFKPAIGADWGLCATATNTWLMEPEAVVRWCQMAWWERQTPKQQ